MRKRKPSALREAVERTAEQTKLPRAYVSRLVAKEKKAIVAECKRRLNALVQRVPAIVAAGLAAERRKTEEEINN